MECPHRGHLDRGRNRDSSFGSRWIATFRKLPRTKPSSPNQMATSTLNVLPRERGLGMGVSAPDPAQARDRHTTTRWASTQEPHMVRGNPALTRQRRVAVFADGHEIGILARPTRVFLARPIIYLMWCCGYLGRVGGAMDVLSGRIYGPSRLSLVARTRTAGHRYGPVARSSLNAFVSSVSRRSTALPYALAAFRNESL